MGLGPSRQESRPLRPCSQPQEQSSCKCRPPDCPDGALGDRKPCQGVASCPIPGGCEQSLDRRMMFTLSRQACRWPRLLARSQGGQTILGRVSVGKCRSSLCPELEQDLDLTVKPAGLRRSLNWSKPQYNGLSMYSKL